MDRRLFLTSMAALGAAADGASAAEATPLGLTLSEAQRQAGRDLLARAPSNDMHSHAGRFFIEPPPGATPLGNRLGPPFGPEAARQAEAARLGAVWLATVADYRLLEPSADGIKAGREFHPGEAAGDHHRQLSVVKAMLKEAAMPLALEGGAISKAWRAGKTACVLCVEGGDFIEDRIERVAQAHADGVRSITIIHYRPNALGDPQTTPPAHGGLTPMGRRVIREMNRLGMLVDLTHASFAASKQAAEVSTRPMILSHSNIATPGQSHPRLISPDHARLVAQHGGVVAALPGGAGINSLADFTFMVLRLIDLVGADHVGVGTDMDFSFKSVVPAYADWSLIPAALLAHGLSAADTLKVMGANALRVLDAA